MKIIIILVLISISIFLGACSKKYNAYEYERANKASQKAHDKLDKE